MSVLIITALVALCWCDYHAAQAGVVLAPLALVLSIAATGEMLSLLSSHGASPVRWACYAGVLAAVAGASLPIFAPDLAAECPLGPLGWPLLGVMSGMLAALVAEMRRYREPGAAAVNLALAVLAMVYVGLLMSFVVLLRLFDGGTGDPRWGMVALLSLVAVVKTGDTGAYTVGRLVGRHKMTPRLSPGKTWEGLVGGLVFACLGSWAIFGVLVPRLGLGETSGGLGCWIVYGLVVGVAGVLGDLTISLLKRSADKKDSSTWLPGLGGVLDLLDSILLAAPVAYVLWLAHVVGP